MALNTGLRDDAGLLFGWKVLVLVVILLLYVFVRRPFCKWFCPLGAFYSLFNKFSFYRMDFEAHACVGCKKCVHACPMGIDVRDDPNNPECIRCGSCKASCPSHAIMSGWKARKPGRKGRRAAERVGQCGKGLCRRILSIAPFAMYPSGGNAR